MATDSVFSHPVCFPGMGVRVLYLRTCHQQRVAKRKASEYILFAKPGVKGEGIITRAEYCSHRLMFHNSAGCRRCSNACDRVLLQYYPRAAPTPSYRAERACAKYFFGINKVLERINTNDGINENELKCKVLCISTNKYFLMHSDEKGRSNPKGCDVGFDMKTYVLV